MGFFWQFIEALRKWRNPIPLEDKRKLNLTKRERFSHISQDDWNPKAFVYCRKKDHKSSDYKSRKSQENSKRGKVGGRAAPE